MSNSLIQNKLKAIQGLVEECLEELEISDHSKKRTGKIRSVRAVTGRDQPNFDRPLRPFVKKFGVGLSGPKKFVLLVAWLTKGNLKKQVYIADVTKQWNKMTSKSLLGMNFNRFFSAQARDNNWVELKGKGKYCLRPSWKDIFVNMN